MRWYYLPLNSIDPAGTVIYCHQTISDLFGDPLTGNVTYCSFDINTPVILLADGSGVYCNRTLLDLFTSPLTGNGVYCSQDLSQL